MPRGVIGEWLRKLHIGTSISLRSDKTLRVLLSLFFFTTTCTDCIFTTGGKRFQTSHLHDVMALSGTAALSDLLGHCSVASIFSKPFDLFFCYFKDTMNGMNDGLIKPDIVGNFHETIVIE